VNGCELALASESRAVAFGLRKIRSSEIALHQLLKLGAWRKIVENAILE